MNHRSKLFLSFVVLSCLGLASIGQSETTATSLSVNSGNLSVLGGLGLLNNGGGGGFAYGGAIAISHAPTWQFGAQYDTFNASSTLSMGNVDGFIRWAPGGSIDGLKLGILAGAGILSSSTPGVSSTTNFNYGATLLYDVGLSDHFSLGPQIDFLWNTGSNNYTDLNVVAALRYWF